MLLLTLHITSACDSDLNIEQIINRAGFDFESHQIKSQGYLLTMYRIPGKSSEQKERPGPPIIFQHGLFDSSFAWVAHHKENAPAFIASNAGYDVWLTNSRGSGPSRKHITYDPDDHHSQFWHFDWQDMGSEDLPAIFEYVEKVTGYEKMALIAHHEGTT